MLNLHKLIYKVKVTIKKLKQALQRRKDDLFCEQNQEDNTSYCCFAPRSKRSFRRIETECEREHCNVL